MNNPPGQYTKFADSKKYPINHCPFCGSKGHQRSNGIFPFWYWISCARRSPAGCNGKGPIRKTAIGAIKAWNWRF
jgi:hypothetical protein